MPDVTGPVLVTGMGLMGSSLAAALTAAGIPVLVHHHRPEVALRAEARGFGRAITDLTTPAAIAVVCTPVSTIPGIVRTIAQGPTPVITDVGSTKGGLVESLADLAPRFIGSHPMCGSHKQGLEAVDPDLYRGRLTMITPTPASLPDQVSAAEALWRAVGCRVLRVDPIRHDHLVAEASHLPHVMANITAALLSAEAAPVGAGGFRDTTRIAAGSPALWADILTANATAVTDLVSQAESRLIQLRHLLAIGDREALATWLAEGHAGRRRFDDARHD